MSERQKEIMQNLKNACPGATDEQIFYLLGASEATARCREQQEKEREEPKAV